MFCSGKYRHSIKVHLKETNQGIVYKSDSFENTNLKQVTFMYTRKHVTFHYQTMTMINL